MSLFHEITIFDIRVSTEKYLSPGNKDKTNKILQQTKILSNSNNFEKSCYFT